MVVVTDQFQAPVVLIPGKVPPYGHERRLGAPRVITKRKTSPSAGNQTRQPIPTLMTDDDTKVMITQGHLKCKNGKRLIYKTLGQAALCSYGSVEKKRLGVSYGKLNDRPPTTWVITISFKQTINYLKLITCLTPNPHKCWV
jgi:hypothetical protein